MPAPLTDLSGVYVVLGNAAPTVSELEPCTEQEAADAGPLGRKSNVGGTTVYAREIQKPAPGIKESYTTFRYPGAGEHDDYGFSKWLSDVRLAFTKQHSFEPPSWVWANNDAVAQVIALEFGCPIAENQQFSVVYHDSPSDDAAE